MINLNARLHTAYTQHTRTDSFRSCKLKSTMENVKKKYFGHFRKITTLCWMYIYMCSWLCKYLYVWLCVTLVWHDDGAIVLLQLIWFKFGTKGLASACSVNARARARSCVYVFNYSNTNVKMMYTKLLTPLMLTGFLKRLLNNLLFYSLNFSFFVISEARNPNRWIKKRKSSYFLLLLVLLQHTHNIHICKK